MQALFATARKASPLEWRDAEAPVLVNSTDAIVAPIAVAACDLDRSIVSGRSPFPGSFMLGHEFTGRVLTIGEDVRNVGPGDVVLASFQPSCGTCTRCGLGQSSVCQAVPNGCMYGIGPAGGDWPGAMTEEIRVPWADHGLRVVPDGIDPVAIASASDNLADGLRCVEGPLAERPGASILVAGSGSIALYAILCADQLGAGSVTFASTDAFALEVAASLGADCLPVDAWPRRFANHDITVDCTNHVDGLGAVVRSTAPYGICTSASIYFGDPIQIPMFNMNMKGITFHTGRVNSAARLHRVLELIGQGLDPERIRPAHYALPDAIDAFAMEPHSRKIILSRVT